MAYADRAFVPVAFTEFLRSARERSRPWVASYGLDVVLCLLLTALTLYVRWASLEPIESGGDPLDNWFWVKQWAHNTGLLSGYLNHHNSRFGIHWLTWIVQRLFGTEPVYYYVAPVFASTLCSLLLYLLGRQIASRAVGVIAVLMLLEFDGFIPASSQLRPGVFEALYILGCVNLLVLGMNRAGASRDRALAGAAFMAFMAWLAKEPTCFFLPGIGLVLLLGQRRVRDLAIFVGVFAFFLGLETLAYNVFTIYPHRAAVIMGSHGRSTPPAHDFWYLFTRFTKADDGWRLVYYFFFAAALALLASIRSFTQKAVVLIAASFLFLSTFAFKSIDPIRLWMPMNDRYLTAAIPLALAANAIVVVEAAIAARAALTRGLHLISRARIDLGVRRWPELMAALALAGCMLGMYVKTRSVTAANRAHHPLDETPRLYALISDAYARGLPMVGAVTGAPKRKGGPAQARSLHWAVKGFVDEKLLLDASGQLPHFSYSSLGAIGKKWRYAPVTPARSDSAVGEMMKSDPECVLLFKDLNSVPNVAPSSDEWQMPERCAATRAQLGK
jgi:dolichyl-phosphate-mannose-protein mannosyltransferase